MLHPSYVQVTYKKLISGSDISTETPTETATETTAPTVAPTVVPTAAPTQTVVPTTTIQPDDADCIKVIAEYNKDGSLKSVKTEKAKKSQATAAVKDGNILTTYWETLENMKPVISDNKPSESDTPTAAPIDEVNVDFTTMSEVPVYSKANSQGFTEQSDAIMPSEYIKKLRIRLRL